MKPLFKSILIGASVSAALLSPVSNAENLTAIAIDNKFKDADAVITQFNDIRASVYTFFDDHSAFPSTFGVLTNQANLYYAGNTVTPFGTPFSGAISADGRFFNISVDLRSPEVAKYVAAKINTTATGTAVLLPVGTPASQALMNNFLSRRYDPTKPHLNEMETDLSMGNHNINNVDTLTATKINISDLATLESLDVLNQTTTLNLTATGVTSLNDLTVETNQLTKGDATFKGNVTVDVDANVGNNLAVGGDVAITGAIAVNGTSEFTGASDFLGSVSIAGNTGITGDLTATNATFTSTDTTTLNVSGLSTLDDVTAKSVDADTVSAGNLAVDQDATIGRDLVVTRDLSVTRDFTVGRDFQVNGDSHVLGDQHITGTLDVGQDVIVNRNLGVVGETTFDGSVIANEEFTAALGIYLENVDTKLEQGDNDSLRVKNKTGFIDIGADNSGYIEFDTDQDGSRFKQKIIVEDEIETRSGLNSVKLRASGAVPEMVFSQSGIERAKFALTAPTTLSLSGAKLVASDAIEAPAFKSTKAIDNATNISSNTQGIYVDYNDSTPFQWSTILHVQDTNNSSRGFQIAMEDTGGALHFRNGNNGGWSDWQTAVTEQGNNTWTGTNTFNKPITLGWDSYLNHNTKSSYDKIRVWNSSNYAMGMAASQNYGWLSDYAMTFTMNADSDRGFLWRDASDSTSDGAMSLTTDGRLMLKNRLGFNNNQSVYLSRDGNQLRTTSPYGYANMGAKDSTSFHFDTDRSEFEFNKQVRVNGKVISQGLESSGDIQIAKNNPWLTLDSPGSGANGNEQSAGISIGESGKKGSAALHLTYTGDGYGHIGMGSVSSSTSLPTYEAMRLHYQSRDVSFLGDINISGNNELRFSSHGGGLYMSDSTWLRTLGSKKFYVSSNASDAIYTAGGVKGLGIGRFDGGIQVDGKWIASSDGNNLYEANQKLSDRYIKKHGTQDISGNKNFYGTATNGQYYDAPIEIREVNLVGSGQSSTYYAPSLAFHWGGRTQTKFALASNGVMHLATNPQLTAWTDLKAGTLFEDNVRLSDKYLGKNDRAKDTEKVGGVDANKFARRDAANTFTQLNTFNREILANGGLKVDGKWVISSDGNTLYEGSTRLVDKYLLKDGKAADADKLDGINSSQFARTDIDENFNHDVSIGENLSVSGTSTFSNAVTANNGLTVNGDWLRVSGQRGIYFQSYGGGVYMTDSTWVRTYGGKGFYVSSTSSSAIHTAGGVHAYGLGRFDGGIQVDGKWIANSSGTALYENGQSLSSRYLGKTAKAADANLLDGLDSSKFLRKDIDQTILEDITMNKTLRVKGAATFDSTVTASDFVTKGNFTIGDSLNDALRWIDECELGNIDVCNASSHSGKALSRIYYGGSNGLDGGDFYLTQAYTNFDELLIIGGGDDKGKRVVVNRIYVDDWVLAAGYGSHSQMLFANASAAWYGKFTSSTRFDTKQEDGRLYAIYGVQY